MNFPMDFSFYDFYLLRDYQPNMYMLYPLPRTKRTYNPTKNDDLQAGKKQMPSIQCDPREFMSVHIHIVYKIIHQHEFTS